MKTNELQLTIPSHLSDGTKVKYISDWKDLSGDMLIDQYISQGRILVNKQTTGCGFTTYCLCSGHHTILVSPRTVLIRNKVEQFNVNDEYCFYYNREKQSNGIQIPLATLELKLTDYLNNRDIVGKPYKIFVTYDSFCSLADMLEQKLGCCINDFRVVVDESHCVLTDVTMKENSIEPVIPRFLQRLFHYENILFISATPIEEFVSQLPEFQVNDWKYLALDWEDKAVISYRQYCCTGPVNAFDKIFAGYSSMTDGGGRNIFDKCICADGSTIYSYQALVFINSVNQIHSILKKYVVDQKRIDVSDVTVVCGDRQENYNKFKDIPRLNVGNSIPKKNDRHTTWTFVTSTAFLGCDFYHKCASTYVIADYRVECMSTDLSKDIHQIGGRLRDENNIFRHKMTIYHHGSSVISDQEFTDMQSARMQKSQTKIDTFNQLNTVAARIDQLETLGAYIVRSPGSTYVRISNGVPVIVESLRIAENYCRSVRLNQKKVYTLNHGVCNYSMEVEKLKAILDNAIEPMARIQATFQCLSAFPGLQDEIFGMLFKWNYTDVAYYFATLPLDRICACGYNTTRMDNEIMVMQQTDSIIQAVQKRFIRGNTYNNKEVKQLLGEAYLEVGIKKTAVATDLPGYLQCTVKKSHGYLKYIIL